METFWLLGEDSSVWDSLCVAKLCPPPTFVLGGIQNLGWLDHLLLEELMRRAVRHAKVARHQSCLIFSVRCLLCLAQFLLAYLFQ